MRLHHVTLYLLLSVTLITLTLATYATFAPILGLPLRLTSVMGESMLPTLTYFDLLYLERVDPSTLQVGDIIVYDSSGGIIVHRIVQLDEEEGQKVFLTKGDNNNYIDPTKVKINMVLGKVTLLLPALGLFLTPVMTTILITLLAAGCEYHIKISGKLGKTS